nr:hypothetical protein [Gemmatimonadota bacterium]NIU76776.1 hypothetical protein [Gammaproteobacteria bacterium]NIY10496.1 hypothetical protein [Gemmatimonadota bacterium]
MVTTLGRNRASTGGAFEPVCGIAGVLRVDGARVRPDLLREMVSRLAHRGPDSRGVATLDGVGLGHARLSIIDPALGRQPMSIRDGELTLTYNGEIFNYLELRDELAGQGHRFRTGSDTEVVLRAYDEYGVECVHHFNGQWAFALWDARRRRLFLSRDRLGIRPLFYARTKKTGAREEFVFA